MKLVKLTLLAISLLATAQIANAQSAKFSGFNVNVSTGFEQDSVTNTNFTAWIPDQGTVPFSNGGNSTSGTAPLVLGAGYNFALTDKYLLGVKVNYYALSNTTNTISPNDGGSILGLSYPVNVSYKISNRWNLILSPAYTLDETKLVYLNLGYSREQVQATYSPVFLGGKLTSNNANLNGYILGLGYRQNLTSQIYAFGEANYMNYNQGSLSGTGSGTIVSGPSKVNSSVGSNAMNFLIGIGYQF